VDSTNEEQNEAELVRRVEERIAMSIEAHSTLPKIIENGVERALRKVLSDQSLREQFWAQGYVELEKHAGLNAAQWIGRRIINIVIVASVAGILAWFVVTGRGGK
jgi:hypothetical protein